MNAVEGFFYALTERRLKRSSFGGIIDLQTTINRYVDEHKNKPKPFVWTKPATTILYAVDGNAEHCVEPNK